MHRGQYLRKKPSVRLLCIDRIGEEIEVWLT
jgi:hypothetical protein